MPQPPIKSDLDPTRWEAATADLLSLQKAIREKAESLKQLIDDQRGVFSPFRTTFADTIAQLELNRLSDLEKRLTRVVDPLSPLSITRFARTLRALPEDPKARESFTSDWKARTHLTLSPDDIPSNVTSLQTSMELTDRQIRQGFSNLQYGDWGIKIASSILLSQGTAALVGAGSTTRMTLAFLDALGAELIEKDNKIERVEWEVVLLSGLINLAISNSGAARSTAKRFLQSPQGLRIAIQLRVLAPDVKQIFDKCYSKSTQQTVEEMNDFFYRLLGAADRGANVPSSKLLSERFEKLPPKDFAGEVAEAYVNTNGAVLLKFRTRLFGSENVIGDFVLGNAASIAKRFFRELGSEIHLNGDVVLQDVPFLNLAISRMKKNFATIAPQYSFILVRARNQLDFNEFLMHLGNRSIPIVSGGAVSAHDFLNHIWGYLTLPKELVELTSSYAQTILVLERLSPTVRSGFHETLLEAKRNFVTLFDAYCGYAGENLAEALSRQVFDERLTNKLSVRTRNLRLILNTIVQSRSKLLSQIAQSPDTSETRVMKEILSRSPISEQLLRNLDRNLSDIIEKQFFEFWKFERAAR